MYNPAVARNPSSVPFFCVGVEASRYLIPQKNWRDSLLPQPYFGTPPPTFFGSPKGIPHTEVSGFCFRFLFQTIIRRNGLFFEIKNAVVKTTSFCLQLQDRNGFCCKPRTYFSIEPRPFSYNSVSLCRYWKRITVGFENHPLKMCCLCPRRREGGKVSCSPLEDQLQAGCFPASAQSFTIVFDLLFLSIRNLLNKY